MFYEPQGDGVWSSCVPTLWSRAVPAARFNPPQHVATVTLDCLIKVFGIPQLVKIDVEGVEGTVIQGLSQKVNFLMFEFNRAFPSEALACLHTLADMGYTKASYVCANLDLQTVPATPIRELAKRWSDAKPEWGMFTVA